MKRSATIPLLLVSALVFAATQDKPSLVDRKSRFALWFNESSFETVDDSNFTIEISGNPSHGYSKDQNLEFSALNFVGKIRKTKEGALLLKSGTMTGSVVLTVTDKDGTSTIKTGKATLDDNGETATVTVPGTFTFANTASTSKGVRTMTVGAPHATFTLKSLSVEDENPLIGGEVSGPVSVKVDEKGEKGKVAIYTLTGQHMTIKSQGTDKVMYLTGGVHMSSDSTNPEKTSFFADFDADQATVVVDKDYVIKKVTTKGNPGTGTLRDKKSGG